MINEMFLNIIVEISTAKLITLFQVLRGMRTPYLNT